jgi:hypothetical protein
MFLDKTFFDLKIKNPASPACETQLRAGNIPAIVDFSDLIGRLSKFPIIGKEGYGLGSKPFPAGSRNTAARIGRP